MRFKEISALLGFRYKINITTWILSICLLASCVTQRKVEYMQDKNKNIKTYKELEIPDYRLKPHDELYIRVNSLDEAATNIFANSAQQSPYTASIDAYGASLLAYSIDKEGNLLMPVIGKIPVKDRTLQEVSYIITDSLNHILNQPVVTVKLVNRFISVLGEVNNPGHFSYSQDKLTLYDAIGLARDITEYGNRNQVILVRNENGENQRINLNLTKSEIFSSEYYIMRPNDILYIKPLRKKFWGMRQFPFSIFFSTITTGLLIYNVMK